MSESLKDATKRNIDAAAGAGTSDKAEGAAREEVGRGKQAIGAAADNNSLRAEGAKDEIVGKAQSLLGDAKHAAEKLGNKIKDATHRD